MILGTILLLFSIIFCLQLQANLDRVLLLPKVDKVISGPSIWGLIKVAQWQEVFSGQANWDTQHTIDLYQIHSQLAICIGHICRSNGYNLRFIGQDRVKETRMLEMWKFSAKVTNTHINIIIRYKQWRNWSLPEKHSTISIDADVKIWDENIVHSSKPLVPEKGVWHPDLGKNHSCWYHSCTQFAIYQRKTKPTEKET